MQGWFYSSRANSKINNDNIKYSYNISYRFVISVP